MDYTTLGRTGLRVSVAGLGTGGFSRMGLKTGKTEDEAARLVCEAVELGVNFIDTAPPYGTEGVVGRALKSIPRDQVVVATKSTVHRNDEWWSPERVVASLDNSLRLMSTDYVDVFNLHAVDPFMYEYARDTLAPALVEQQAKGKIRHIGLTENPILDHTNETIMLAVRSIFADPPRVAREMKALAAKGLVEPWLGATDDPLSFLVHEAGAANMIEAAYRFARHEPGVDVVLFGTGDAAHLRSNVASLLKPPLPEVDRAKLVTLFGHLTGIGLDGHQAPAPR